ncbi:MAG: glycosyltransferase family 39 protein [Actinobacteria bacterium]|nr:glycosyltransferase family 39 protein [Actinomycetota bacterium]
MQRLRRRPRVVAAFGVVAIVIVSAALRIIINWNTPGPWIFVDELIYSELGRSAFDGMGIRGIPVSGYGPVYPLLIGPAYAVFENLPNAYAAVKVTNALVMSLTAIPVYFIGRVLLNRRWSLIAAALSVVIPAMAYTGVVMTENAFYPAFALTMLFIIRSLERRTVIWQLLVFAGAALCFEIRPQGAVVVPAFLLSALLLVIFDARAAELGERGSALVKGIVRFAPTWGIAVFGVIGIVALQAQRGLPIGSLLGAYSSTTELQDRYHWRPILTWFLLHIAELDLWLGVLPVLAFLVLVGFALSRTADRQLRVFAAATVPIVLLMAGLVAAFVVFANVNRVEERNLFYVGFLPLVALCWWVANGLPRQSRWFPIALAIVAVLPVALPYPSLINLTAISDTFGLYLPWAVQTRLVEGMLTSFAVAAGVVTLVTLIICVPPRRGKVLIAVAVALFVLTSVAVNQRTDKASAGAVVQGIGGPRNWIDAAVGASTPVDVLYPGTSEPLRVWENEFFNRSLRDVLALGAPMPGGLPETVVNADTQGNVRNRPGFQIDTDFVLVDSSTTVIGSIVASDPGTGMSVVQVEKPLRLQSSTTGVYLDGWTGPQATYTRFACTGGMLTVTASLDGVLQTAPVTIAVAAGPRQDPPITVDPSGVPSTISTRLVPVDGQCQVTYTITPTAIPAEVLGSTDTRALGVLMRDFAYSPGS